MHFESFAEAYRQHGFLDFDQFCESNSQEELQDIAYRCTAINEVLAAHKRCVVDDARIENELHDELSEMVGRDIDEIRFEARQEE